MTTPPDKSCCFTGHRKITENKLSSIVERLDFEIEYLIGMGVRHFYTGGALGFDTIAALSVLMHIKKGADISLHLMLPCPDQTKFWSDNDITAYNQILECATTVTTLSDHYHGGVMQIRNRAMVDTCEFCICYWDKEVDVLKKGGGTLYTVNYARKLNRKIVNLWDEPPENIQIEFDFD